MQLNIKQAIRIYTSDKDFIIITFDINNAVKKITSIILTNDLHRHYNSKSKFQTFRVLDDIKNNIKKSFTIH